MVSSSNIEEEFVEAKNNWNLEKLYIDLASSKGKALTPVERKFLRGLLCGLSPAEIAHIVYKTRSSSTVRVYLSNGLYKYLEEMLTIQAGKSIKVKNWSHVTHLLEKAGYKKSWQPMDKISSFGVATNQAKADSVVVKSFSVQDWGGAIDVSLFHGRAAEMSLITDWIVEQHCRLVLVSGMGGIGKTALSVKVAQQLQEQFDYVIWRSLNLLPSLDELLAQLIQILLPEQELSPSITLAGKITKLIDCLRSARCLIVLDGWESVLDSNCQVENEVSANTLNRQANIIDTSLYFSAHIGYRPDYQAYGKLLQTLTSSHHHSCVIVTSREKPPEMSVLTGEKTPLRSLKLRGLTPADVNTIFIQNGISNISGKKYQIILDVYGGNPLFIQFAASTIQELFAGNIDEFLAQEALIFGNIRTIIEQQFQRLSELEKQIIHTLALHNNIGSLQDIQTAISPQVPQRLIMEAVELLQKRSLIEGQASDLFLTPVITEYIIESLIESTLQFWANKPGYMFFNRGFFTNHMKNYKNTR
ncbi:MAG: NB-ARC domain-containing protein [Calothrix sp. MO_167.B42]|nr:NB-ARC domain-containing protein [Calothrix sp. MO_167.B42]